MDNSLPTLEQYEPEIRGLLISAHEDKKNTSFELDELNSVEQFNGQDNGCNSKLMRAAWAFVKARIDEDKAYGALHAIYSSKYGNAKADQQVSAVIQKSYHPKDEGKPYDSAPKFEEPSDKEQIENIRKITTGFDCIELLNHIDMKPSEYLNKLYSDEALLCISPDPKRAKTMRKAKAMQVVDKKNTCYFVANPMIAKTGKAKEGHESCRCKNNATQEGEELYIVYENDLGGKGEDILTENEQFKLLAFLVEVLPVVSVAFSGGKSYHVLISVQGLASHKIRALKQLLINLGADKAVLQPWQLSRLPNAKRDNGKVQELLYFDEKVIGKAPSST